MNFEIFPLSKAPAWAVKAPVTPARYSVQGKRATSYEYNLALALDYYRLAYKFQVDYWGGRSFLGGIVLDFLVFTVPNRTPIFVNGDYWHSGSRQDIDAIQTILLSAIPDLRTPVILWGADTNTYEAAKTAVRLKIV